MLFLKTKAAKAPSMKPPRNEQPKISLLWRSSYLGWSSRGCRSGSSALNTSFSHAQISGWGSRAGWVPSQCYLVAPSVLSAYSEDKFMPCLHPESPKSKLFLFSPFIKIFVLVILPAARVVYIDPFHCSSLLLCIYQYWLVAFKFVRKCGNSACWFISDSCFLLTVLPLSTIFPPGVNSGLHWVSGNFAFSFHQAKISSVIFRYHHEFAPSFIVSACSETCFLYSLSTPFLFLPMPFPLNAVLWLKVLVGKPGEIFAGKT